MEEKSHKIRIKDIAELAGVSEGTVDRVLHKRGDVSEKSKDAVNKVLKEINYTPNILARSLALKKIYHFVCIYPEHNEGDYWTRIDEGFDLAAKDFSHYNVQIERKYYNQYDVNSFVSLTSVVKESKPDAVIIAPIFKEETLEFSNELKNLGIPFAFIDSMIEESDFLTYYGQNSFTSGYIAANLLLNSLAKNSQIIIIRTKRKGSVSNQTIGRHKGFMDFIDKNGLTENIQLINVEFQDDDEMSNLNKLKETFANNTNIQAAITFNSKVYRLAKHLKTINQTDVRLIGYDLLEQNVEFLNNGVISYLIAQRPEKQAYLSIRDLCRELIFKQEIKKLNYVPIDILMKENIEDYINFQE